MPNTKNYYNYSIPFLFFLILSFSAQISFAAPSGGTRLPGKGHAETGYEFNVMFERPLARSYGDLKTQNHFYTLSLGIFEWLSLDGKIGTGDTDLKGGIHLPKLEFNDGFAGAYGLRVKIFEHEKTRVRLIAGMQHISVHPPVRSVWDDKYKSFIDDWQISGLVAKDFKYATPYVGIKGSDCEFVYKINDMDKKRRYSEYHIGLITGLDVFLFDNKVRINVESRFFDETSLSTAVAYLF